MKILAGTDAGTPFNFQDDIGVLAKGKNADILIVEGNVLSDIRILCDPANIFVIHNGKTVRK